MRKISSFALPALMAALIVAGCATHQRDFIPNGAGVNLAPTDPSHIQVLESVPRGMVIGTVLVDRSKAKDTNEIIQQARQKAAAVGGDFIVWEDSLGTLPTATPAPGAGPVPPSNDSGQLGHTSANPDVPPPEETIEKTPKARFTVGIFVPSDHSANGQ